MRHPHRPLALLRPLPSLVLAATLVGGCAPDAPPDDEALPAPPFTEDDAEVEPADQADALDDEDVAEGWPSLVDLWDELTEDPIEDDSAADPLEEDPLGEEPADGPFEEPDEGGADADLDHLDEPADAAEGAESGVARADFPKRKFLLPFTCGKRVRVSQGNNTSFSHQGFSRWAYDFSVKTGTKVRAMRNGRVTHLRRATGPGDACYNGGGSSCRTKANYVVLRHADGTSTMYAHLSRVTVRVGERVKRGEVIGRSGNTGYSTGPHLHVARQERCGSSHCQSIKLRFADVPGDHMPNSGQRVRSKNGCD